MFFFFLSFFSEGGKEWVVSSSFGAIDCTPTSNPKTKCLYLRSL